MSGVTFLRFRYILGYILEIPCYILEGCPLYTGPGWAGWPVRK